MSGRYRPVGSVGRGDDDINVIVVGAIIPGVVQTDAVIHAAAD
jgi:hypothetical protein